MDARQYCPPTVRTCESPTGATSLVSNTVLVVLSSRSVPMLGSRAGRASLGMVRPRVSVVLCMMLDSTVPNEKRLVCPSARSEEHTSELQSRENLVCRLLLEKKNKI